MDFLPTDNMTTDVRENRRLIEQNKNLRERFVTSVRTLGLVVGGVSGLYIASTPPIQEAARGILINNPDLVSQLVHTLKGVDGHTLVSYAEMTAKAIGVGGLGALFGGLGHLFADTWSKMAAAGDFSRARAQTSAEAVQNRAHEENVVRERKSAKVEAQRNRLKYRG